MNDIMRSDEETRFIDDFEKHWTMTRADITRYADSVTTGKERSIECVGIYSIFAVDGEVHASITDHKKKRTDMYVWPMRSDA